MTSRFLRTLMCLLAFVTTSTAIAAADPYDDANSAAARGDHAAAAKAFTQALDEDGWSANALLGLGNAYASLGDPGHAILAYERALVLAPRDHAIATNLARVRESAGLPASRPSRIDAVVGQVRSDTWAWTALGALATACAGLLVLAWTRRRALGGTLVSIGTAIVMFAGAAAQHAAPDLDTAVVVVQQSARIAPVASAEEAFTARAGQIVHIEKRHGAQVYVRDRAANLGWLPADAVERVIPGGRISAKS